MGNFAQEKIDTIPLNEKVTKNDEIGNTDGSIIDQQELLDDMKMNENLQKIDIGISKKKDSMIMIQKSLTN